MEAPVDLDDQIRRIEGLLATSPTHEVVGPLVILLLSRGNIAVREDRDEEASADYSAAAGLLASYPDDDLPVDVPTARMVWASWAARARHEGRLEEALAAASRAVALRHDLPVDDLQPYAGFSMDLKNLTLDFEGAGRSLERVESARLAVLWSRALSAVDPGRFEPMLGMTGVALAKALGDAGERAQAVEVAYEAAPVLRRRRLGAILVSLLVPLGAWLREESRWEESVDVEGEALAEVRLRTSRQAVVEVHLLRMLAHSLVGAGRPDDARTALIEALNVIKAPGTGVVPLRADQVEAIGRQVRADLGNLDSVG